MLLNGSPRVFIFTPKLVVFIVRLPLLKSIIFSRCDAISFTQNTFTHLRSPWWWWCRKAPCQNVVQTLWMNVFMTSSDSLHSAAPMNSFHPTPDFESIVILKLPPVVCRCWALPPSPPRLSTSFVVWCLFLNSRLFSSCFMLWWCKDWKIILT